MSLKLVPFGDHRASKTKSVALAAFRLIRSAQAKAAQVPGAVLEARNDVVGNSSSR